MVLFFYFAPDTTRDRIDYKIVHQAGKYSVAGRSRVRGPRTSRDTYAESVQGLYGDFFKLTWKWIVIKAPIIK
jgi:hypothetical protein